MSEIAKVTTPITNKNIIQPVKEQRSGDAAALDFQDTSRVLKMTPESRMMQQNTSNIDQQTPASLLMNLMTDPQVTVGYMRSILMLKEIVALLPMQSESFTQEIEQLFSQLQVAPDQIAGELLQQENASTAFKGELFDFLRGFLTTSQDPQSQTAVVNFLKAVNSETNRGDILNALSASFGYLSEVLSPSKSLSAQLEQLAQQFRGKDAQQNFHDTQQKAGAVLMDVERSILFNEKTEKLVSMIRYNLSRYNDNTDFLGDATNALMNLLPEEQRPELLQNMYQYLTQQQILAKERVTEEAAPLSGSQVMNSLTQILEKQAEGTDAKLLKQESVEGIVHSILSSPSNFTPLLHYILPVMDESTNSIAEMWINPDEEQPPSAKGGEQERTIHMLLVFDIESMGRFETDLYVQGRQMSVSLLCPPEHTERISAMASTFRKCVTASDFQVRDLNIGKLERPRSLVEVFPTLPEKRTGINVRI